VPDVATAYRSRTPGHVEFSVSVTVIAGGSAVVEVTGDIDCYSSPQLRGALLELAGAGVADVVVDLRRSPFVDSTGLGVLVGGKRRFRSEGGDLVLRSPSPATVRLLGVAGLTEILAIA